MSTLSNTLHQKVLTLALLTEIGHVIFVATMTTFISYYYYDMEETITQMNSLKLKIYPGKTLWIAVQKSW